ncbi:MAG: thrombospondin type 3 repeat-containing protein [Planctomycetes bacterium]|nr:thrombospondin type 3 repeat-containing protein [Planctomycetota bacterium]MBI3835345.1 thrombospondin type 3 repeat-containing protein [Planctomycetota bacterium]
MKPKLTAIILGVLAMGYASSARGAIIITLQANNGDLSTGVAPGSQVAVDVLLSVDAQSDPITDVRLLQLNFRLTSPGIVLSDFLWLLAPTIDDTLYQESTVFPQPIATYIASSRREGQILDLDQIPVLVASFTATVNGSGAIDMRFKDIHDITTNNLTIIRAGFGTEDSFVFSDRSITGGRLTITVVGGGPDRDHDGVPDAQDAFPNDPTEWKDTDHDGIGDNADTDDDNDGVPDAQDAFPLDSKESVDTDHDGIGNNADPDDDNDGVPDAQDAFPLDPTETSDCDHNGIGDNSDPNGVCPTTRNTGPRATGGGCGAIGLLPGLTMLVMLHAMRSSRPVRLSKIAPSRIRRARSSVG